jgi:hypothetical protein
LAADLAILFVAISASLERDVTFAPQAARGSTERNVSGTTPFGSLHASLEKLLSNMRPRQTYRAEGN